MADIVTRIKADNSQYTASLKGCTKELDNFIRKTTGVNGVASTTIGLFAKFAGAIGVVTGAQQIFDRVINSSRANQLAYNKIVDSLSTSVNTFFYAISNGDFQSFIVGLDRIIAKAQEVTAAMANMNKVLTANNYVGQKLQTQIAHDREITMNPHATKAQKNAAIADWKKTAEELRQSNLITGNSIMTTVSAKLTNGTFLATNPKKDALIYNRLARVPLQRNRKALEKYYNDQWNQYYKASGEERQRNTDTYTVYDASGGAKSSYIVNKKNDDAAQKKLAERYREAIIFHNMYKQMSKEDSGNIQQMMSSIDSLNEQSYMAQAKLYRRESAVLRSSKSKSGSSKAKTEEVFDFGSLGWYDQQISGLQKKLSKATTDSARGSIQDKIDELSEDKKKIEESLNPKEGTDAWTNRQISRLEAKIKELEHARAELEKLNPKVGTQAASDKSKKMQSIDSQSQIAQQQIQALEMNRVGDKITAMFNTGFARQHPIKALDIEVQNHKDSILANLDLMTNGFRNLGEEIGGQTGNWMQWGATVAQTVGQALPLLMSMTSEYWKEYFAASNSAAAQSAAAVAGIPFVGPVLAVAAVGSIIAAFASIPKFASGGIVGGHDYADGIMARVSSGEMIINQRQQKQLWRQIEQGNKETGIGKMMSSITGEQIITVVNNVGKRRGKGNLIKI